MSQYKKIPNIYLHVQTPMSTKKDLLKYNTRLGEYFECVFISIPMKFKLLNLKQLYIK